MYMKLPKPTGVRWDTFTCVGRVAGN